MDTNNEPDYIGRGWSFRRQFDPETGQNWFGTGVNARGGISLSRASDEIAESIYIVLMTSKGERVMRPNFGSNIHDLVFMNNDATTWGLIDTYIRDALGWYEPRIRVDDVQVRQDPRDEARLIINIYYTIKATNDPRNLVFPFYIIPGENNDQLITRTPGLTGNQRQPQLTNRQVAAKTQNQPQARTRPSGTRP